MDSKSASQNTIAIAIAAKVSKKNETRNIPLEYLHGTKDFWEATDGHILVREKNTCNDDTGEVFVKATDIPNKFTYYHPITIENDGEKIAINNGQRVETTKEDIIYPQTEKVWKEYNDDKKQHFCLSVAVLEKLVKIAKKSDGCEAICFQFVKGNKHMLLTRFNDEIKAVVMQFKP